jgi:RND family efflux transporter MFP subunit
VEGRIVIFILRVSLVAWLALAGAAVAQQDAPAPVEVVEAVGTEMAARVWAPGTVVSRGDARIASEGAGQLAWVAEVGDKVSAGDPVARIDASALELELRDDDAQIRRLEADLAFATQQLERRRQLSAQQIISAHELEETEATHQTAVQNLEAARVAREQTLFRLSRTTVRAPFSGRVVERLQEPGGYTAIGREVVRLVDVDRVEVQAQAPLAVERFVREGLRVTVSGRDREGAGTVRRVVRVGDATSRMFEIRVALEGEPWVVGSPVRVALPSSDARTVVAVPRDALILRSAATYVFRITDDDTAERIVVETGTGDSDLIAIEGDVAPGDRIVVRGGERLRVGQAVEVIERNESGGRQYAGG